MANRNIVLLMDGTANEISANRTNVLRLYGVLKKSDEQIVYYDPGVGTFGADQDSFRFWRKTTELWGMASGWGLDHNVKEAYRFLVDNYDRGTGGKNRDRIYLFGFSRGAYSARVLAGFIHAVGLLEPRNLNLLDYAYRAYKRVDESGADPLAEVRLYERALQTDRPPIRLLGLFDTVSSVIESGSGGPRLRSHAFTQKGNTSVETVRHAVAIHERRTMFRTQVWPEGGEYWGNPFNYRASRPQDVKEAWFQGTHGDVGGGYPEAQSGLAKIPLLWMIDHAKTTGLKFNTRTINKIVLGIESNEKNDYVAPNPTAPANESMTGLWPILEYIPTKTPEGSTRPSLFGISIPRSERRSIPEGARIHQSVFEQADAGGALPINLPKTYKIDKGVEKHENVALIQKASSKS